MQSFILAGGFATRLWPLTEKRPKPLLPLAGKPILTHLVEKIPAGMPITVSTNAAFAETFHAWKSGLRLPSPEGRGPGRGVDIEIVIEDTGHEDEKLGALGATAKWITESKIDDDLLLLAGDNYIGASLEECVNVFDGNNALVLAYDIREKERAKHFGVVSLAADGKTVTAFTEKPREPTSTLVSTGCMVLPKATLPILIEFAKLKPDNIGGVFEELLRRDVAVQCIVTKEPWFDIGSFDAYLEATRALVSAAVHKEESATLDNSTCEGSVVLGKGCRVTGSRLRDTVLFEDCVIEDCVLENCVIDASCKLHGIDLQGKMLREGTVLKKAGRS